MKKISFKEFLGRISFGCVLVFAGDKKRANEELPFKPNEDGKSMQYSKIVLTSYGFKREKIDLDNGQIRYSRYDHSKGTRYFTMGGKYLIVSSDSDWLVYAVPYTA